MALPEVGLTAVIENMDGFERSADQIEKSYDSISQAATPVERATEGVSDSLDAFAGSAVVAADGMDAVAEGFAMTAGSAEEAGESISRSAAAMSAVSDVASTVATGGLSLLQQGLSIVGTLFKDVALAGFNFASEIGTAMGDVAAQTGATGDELAQFRDIAENVYETGLGENFEEAAQAMVKVEQVTGATGDALQGLTIDALSLSRVFDKDVGESIRAVDQAMTTLGVEGGDAFDMITVAIQQTGDPADDLLDTVNEYSSTFAEAGFSAEEMFAILTSGIQAGMHNFDAVADTVREFFIRLQDGSDTTRDALNALFSTPGDAVSTLKTQIDGLNVEIEQQETALAGARSALDAAKASWDASKQTVSDLKSALSQARSELAELSRPNLAGFKELDDHIFSLGQQAKEAQLRFLDLEQQTEQALSGMVREMDNLNRSIAAQEAELSGVESALGDARSAWGASQKVVDDLKGALDEAKRELAELSRPKLEGMEEYDDQMFELEQQSKKARLALLDLEEGTPEFEAAQAELDKLNDEMERLQLAHEIEYDEKFRELEKAAADGTEEVVTFDEAMKRIADKKEEIADLETSFSDAETAAAADRAEVERLEGIHAALSDSLEDNRARLASLNDEFEREKAERLAAARAELERINTELQKAQLQKEIEFAPKFRELEEAVRGGTGEVLSFDEAMARVGQKKGEIANLEGALAGAEAAAAADASAVRGLESNYNALETALGNNKDRLGVLSDELETAKTPADEFLEAFASGGVEGKEALSTILQALQQIEDPLERNQLGVALFGSKWEDFGEAAVQALDPSTAALGEFEGATNTARETAETGLGPAWERLKRIFQTSLADGFEPILAMIVENLVPAFESFAEWLDGPGREVLEKFGTFIAETLGPALENLGPFVEEKVVPALQGFADWVMEEGIPALEDLVEWFKTELIPWVVKTAKWIDQKVIPALKDFGKALEKAKKIAEKVIKPFQLIGETVDKVIDFFITAKDTIPEILGDLLKSVIDWGRDLGREVMTFLGSLLRDIVDWGRDLIREWMGFLGSLLRDIVGWGGDLIREWMTFLGSLLRDIVDWGGDLIRSWMTFLGSLLRDIVSWGGDLIREWMTFLGDLLRDIVDWGGDLIREWMTFLGSLLRDVIDWGGDLIREFMSFLGDLLSDIISWGGDLLREFGTIFSDVIGAAVQFGIDLVSEFTTMLGNAVQTVIDFASDMAAAAGTLMQGLIDGISGAAQSVVDALSGVIEGAIAALENLVASAGQFGSRLFAAGSSIIQRVVDGIGEIASDVSTSLQTAISSAVDALPNLLVAAGELGLKLIQRGKEIIYRIKDGIQELLMIGGEEQHPLWIAIKNVISSAITSLASALESGATIAENIIQTGKDLVQRIIDGVTDMAGDFWAALVGVINDAIEKIFGVRPFPEPSGRGQNLRAGGNPAMRMLGQSMAIGMAQGIYDQSSLVAQAMVWTVNSAFAAAQRAAGIHSPSTLFAGIGADIGRGLQLGLASQVPAVSAQLSALVTAPAQVAAPALGATGTTSVTNVFHVGGNTITSGMDEAVFEARVVDIVRRELA